ncbi:hypothetical protein VM1G_06469 [Cytospora mali]|uniref:HC-toxin efflux carrier TOXA n=1 Tax=Cytospora mali TaxID=578113 RepID=A0A194W2T1_CYTMA|nr:hypothetical protein VM1G_06469 [Valsa mali]
MSGNYMPYMVLGEIICLSGLAMLTQLRPETDTVYWAAALVITGLGSGMAMQMPYSAISVVLADDDIAGIAVFLNQLGGALAVSLGQTITLSTLVDLVPQRLPDVSLQSVKDASASNLASLHLNATDLTILRDIWNTAIVRTMILSTAFIGATLPFTLGMEWLNTKKEAETRRQAGALEAQGNAQVVEVDV